MRVYLVRHGETIGNVSHRHQPEDTPLSKRGEAQVQAVAEVLQVYQPTHLLTSNLVRAIETARVIGERCGLIAETSEHFVELKRPERMYGRYHKSIQSMLFYIFWYFGLTKSGESYKEIRNRIAVARGKLESYPADATVVVVAHSVFINLFITHLCSDRAMTPWSAAKTFYGILTMKNTAVVAVDYVATDAGECGWKRVR